MPRLSVFNSPFLLGFEQFEQTLDRISKMSAEGYPPYNIVSAELDNGLLHVNLMRPEPEPRIRKIKIKRRSTRGGPMDVISTARAPKEDC